MTMEAEVSDAIAGFDDGGKGHQPQMAGSVQKLEKARKHSLLEPPEGL